MYRIDKFNEWVISTVFVSRLAILPFLKGIQKNTPFSHRGENLHLL